MDLHLFDRSEKIKPILIRLFDSREIYGLAKDKDAGSRTELTAIVTELLDCDLSAAESELVADVLIQIMRRAEYDLRKALSKHICDKDSVPLKLAIHMANDDLDIAGDVLEFSPVFNDLDLIYIIKSKPAEYWQRIAMRAEISHQLQQVLIETKDPRTVQTLADNEKITLSDESLEQMTDLCRSDEMLLKSLISRPEIPQELIEQVYTYAGSSLRQYIHEKTGYKDENLDAVIDHTTNEVNIALSMSEGDGAGFNPFGVAEQETVIDNEQRVFKMMNTLRAGNINPFIRQFAELTKLDKATIRKVLEQKSAKGLAIICRAYDIQKPDFVSIFLLTNSVRNKGQMVGMGDMSSAVDYFNRIEPNDAREILEQMRAETI